MRWTAVSLLVLVGACSDADEPGGAPRVDATSGTPPGDAPEAMQGVLDLHNEARAAASSPPLSWNAALAADAQTWADGCQWGHDPDRNFEGQIFGENIAQASASYNAEDLTQLWLSEQDSYDCEANDCAAGQQCGHYTQIIWRSSTELGCGVADCGSRYLVCRYLPAGNYIGERPVPVEDCP